MTDPDARPICPTCVYAGRPVPLDWPPHRMCENRAAHYEQHRKRPLVGFAAILHDLGDAAQRYEWARNG